MGDNSGGMKRTVILALLAGAIGSCAAYDYGRLYYLGPASDHFDGRMFFNPAGAIGKGALDVIQWRLKGGAAQWPDTVPLPATAKPPERVDGDELRVTFVGHATVLIQTGGFNILTDPHWSERAFFVDWAGPRRVTPPGIAFEDLPPIDLVLVSHNHYDHMDLPTLARLREAHDPLVVAPLGNEHVLLDGHDDLRVHTLDWWQRLDFSDRVRVHVVPVYHWSRRRLFDRNKALWGGFVVETPGGNIYYGGDTGLWDGAYFREARERFGSFRLALLPVGAYEPRWFMKDQHVNPAEAVQIHRLLGAQATLGVHLRTFQLTDEPIDQPEIELAAALREAGVPAEQFFTLPVGGSWTDGGPR
jgi:L-ascorbate metabolism protein UlaG (beta-lactamase superfamily)